MTDDPTPERAAPPAAPPTRRLDARSLRGLAHPLPPQGARLAMSGGAAGA
ncbi:hypothetical protein [Streptomyces scopuliridis]